MRTRYFQVQNGQFGLRIFLEKVMRMKSSRRWEKKKKKKKSQENKKLVKFICPRQPGKGTETETETETDRETETETDRERLGKVLF